MLAHEQLTPVAFNDVGDGASAARVCHGAGDGKPGLLLGTKRREEGTGGGGSAVIDDHPRSSVCRIAIAADDQVCRCDDAITVGVKNGRTRPAAGGGINNIVPGQAGAGLTARVKRHIRWRHRIKQNKTAHQRYGRIGYALSGVGQIDVPPM